MFPGPGAQVYYNDAGEPIGWDYPPDPEDRDPYDDDRDQPYFLPCGHEAEDCDCTCRDCELPTEECECQYASCTCGYHGPKEVHGSPDPTLCQWVEGDSVP